LPLASDVMKARLSIDWPLPASWSNQVCVGDAAVRLEMVCHRT
jgi:hypothetical protein